MALGPLALSRYRKILLIVVVCAIAPLTSAYAAGDYASTIGLGGIFTQFLFFADDAEGPAEKLNPVGNFNYSRIYVDARTNLPKSVYVRLYTQVIVNNWSTVNAEQSYLEVGSLYGQLRAGIHKPFNEQVVDKPAPQAALAVGDEIFSAMINPRTNIPQRDG